LLRTLQNSRKTERQWFPGFSFLILLHYSFSAPHIQHLLHCSPSAGRPALVLFDEFRFAVSPISNYVLSDDQRLQASLPIKDGGLEIRSVSLVTPAFWPLLQAPFLDSSPESWLRVVTHQTPFFNLTSHRGPWISVLLPFVL